MGQLGRESKQHHEGWGQAIQQQTGQLMGMITSLGSVAAVVGKVGEAYSRWKQLMGETAQKEGDFSQRILEHMAKIGAVARAPQIEEAVKAMIVLRHVPREKAAAAVMATEEAIPAGDLSGEARQSLAWQLGRHAARFTPEGFAQYAKMATRVQAHLGPGENTLSLIEAMQGRVAPGEMDAVAGPEFTKAMRALVETRLATRYQALALAEVSLSRWGWTC